MDELFRLVCLFFVGGWRGEKVGSIVGEFIVGIELPGGRKNTDLNFID
jgi:hypothetical protein